MAPFKAPNDIIAQGGSEAYVFGNQTDCFIVARGTEPTKWEDIAADAKACEAVMRGIKPGKRCANIDLPLPGGPFIKRLWPPAAAISNARFGPACARTDAKSSDMPCSAKPRGNPVCNRTQPSVGGLGGDSLVAKAWATSRK